MNVYTCLHYTFCNFGTSSHLFRENVVCSCIKFALPVVIKSTTCTSLPFLLHACRGRVCYRSINIQSVVCGSTQETWTGFWVQSRRKSGYRSTGWLWCVFVISVFSWEMKTPSSTYKLSAKSSNHKGPSKKFIRVSDLCIVLTAEFSLCLSHWIECHHKKHMCACLGGVGLQFPTVLTRRGLQSTTQWVTLSPPPLHLRKSYRFSGASGPRPLSLQGQFGVIQCISDFHWSCTCCQVRSTGLLLVNHVNQYYLCMGGTVGD